MKSRLSGWRLSGLAVVAALACLALTACGGGGSAATTAGDASTPSPGAEPTSSASFTAFDNCLKSHGVKVPAGGFGRRPFSTASPHPFSTASPRPHPSFTGRPGGFASGADSAAFKACQKYAPAGFGRFGNGAGLRAISASALAAFKSCMAQNGVTVKGTTAQQIFASLRNATGKTATADKTCRVLLQTATATPTPSS
jgi:hypothetical protein